VHRAEGERLSVATAGDESFREFYRRELAPQVRRAALLVGSDEAAHDIVHDAMVEVYRQWDRLARPGGYLNRSVLNGCRDFGRRATTQRRLLPRLVDRTPHPASDGDRFDELLAALPFHHRAAVVLRFYCDLTTAEIAAELGCPPGSVGPWIERGLQRLRKAIV
jgi:RNA polymerase sigma factor (sigma-70 family)